MNLVVAGNDQLRHIILIEVGNVNGNGFFLRFKCMIPDDKISADADDT